MATIKSLSGENGRVREAPNVSGTRIDRLEAKLARLRVIGPVLSKALLGSMIVTDRSSP